MLTCRVIWCKTMRKNPFLNRHQAGQVLATWLAAYANRPDVIVLALPRGGVAVAYPVALALNAPLDVLTVRKLALPAMPELAIGAIATGGIRVLNEGLIREINISGELLAEISHNEQKELERREHLYRADRPPLSVAGKEVIVVDDGLATGTTMRAALKALKGMHPARVVVAVPVAAAETYYQLKDQVDEIVCILIQELLFSIGEWYQDFSQTTNGEVCRLLDQAARRPLLETGQPA